MAETYKKLTYDSKKIQVDSAVRDGNGAQIDTTYLKKAEGVTQVKVGTTAYNPSSGVISLPAYPTVPTVNNGTLNIQGDANTVGSFTANATGTTNINFASGTKVSIGRDTTNKKLTINHANTTRTDTTSTASPAHGGTFTAVDSVSTDATGHITAINVKTVTLPTDQNTDKYVDQIYTTGNYDLPLVMGNHVASNTNNYNADVYHASNIYANPSTGKITSTLISASQVKGGLTKAYTINATGYKTIAQMKDATTYWTTNGGHAYVKLYIEASTIAEGTIGATNMKSASWIVTATYSGVTQSIFTEPINANAGTGAGILRYFASFVPKSTSYCPQIAVALDTANTNVYVRVTILSSSEGWQLPSSIGGDPGTTNYTRWYVEQGRYNYNYFSNKVGANITGGCDGVAGSTWDSIRNDRYVFGESAVAGSIMAMATDGRMYKLRNGANKVFTLPLHCGRCTGTFTYNGSVSPPTLTNYAQIMWNMRSQSYAELTNATMQGTAFTVPTLTAGQYGLPLYITGTLSGSGFVPDGNIVTAMVNNKTNIQIGRIDRANTALNAVPTLFTITGYGQNAYTLDSNGKLTHIDGKEIKDADTTSIPWGSVTSKPFVSFGNTIAVTNNVADVRLGYTTSGKNYAIAKDSSGNLYVNVPWTDNNTDTLMTQNVSTGNNTYPILACPTANATTNQGAKTGIFASSIKLNPSTGTVYAKDVKVEMNGGVGTDDSATPYGKVRFAYVSESEGNILSYATITSAGTVNSVTNKGIVSVEREMVKFKWEEGTTTTELAYIANANTRISSQAKGDIVAGRFFKNYASSYEEIKPVSFTRSLTSGTKIGTITIDGTGTDIYCNAGTVTSVKVGSTSYTPSSGVVSLPAYPTVNNATLTIQKNGTNVSTFTANASSNVTANITVPTKVSELTNDSGYTTNIGTVTSVKVGSTSYSPSSGVVSLPAYPTVPTVNNGTFNIQGDGTTVQSFTANASGTTNMNFVSGTGISLARDTTNKKITVNHSNSITAGTAGQSTATSGATLAVPYVTYDAQGHVTAKGTHTHSVTALVIGGSATNTTLPTASSVQLYKGSINGSASTVVWLIETYLSGNYGFQRATSLADASEVNVRTRNNSTTWSAWAYSYAVWKP